MFPLIDNFESVRDSCHSQQQRKLYSTQLVNLIDVFPETEARITRLFQLLTRVPFVPFKYCADCDATGLLACGLIENETIQEQLTMKSFSLPIKTPNMIDKWYIVNIYWSGTKYRLYPE